MSYHGTPLATLRSAVDRATSRVDKRGLRHRRKLPAEPTPAKLALFAAYRESHGMTLGRKKLRLGGGRGKAPSMPTFNLPPMPEDD